MSLSLSQFAQWIGGIGQNVDPLTTQIVKEMVHEMAPVLVKATPVDTGRARSNWQGAVNNIPQGILYYPAPLAPSSASDGTAEGIQSINDAANAYKGRGYIAIANNVPYIGVLNTGSSSQAPAGFVEDAVLAGIMSLNGKSILVP